MSDTPLPLSLHVITGELSAEPQNAVLSTLAERMAHIIGEDRQAAILHSACEREALESTYIGRGIAVPHARVAGLPGASVLIAKSPRGIAWPEQTAHLIIFLAVPEERPDIYLQLLGGVMRWRHSSGLSTEQILAMSPSDTENSLRSFLKL